MTLRCGGASRDHSQPTARPSNATVDSTLTAGSRSRRTTTRGVRGCHSGAGKVGYSGSRFGACCSPTGCSDTPTSHWSRPRTRPVATKTSTRRRPTNAHRGGCTWRSPPPASPARACRAHRPRRSAAGRGRPGFPSTGRGRPHPPGGRSEYRSSRPRRARGRLRSQMLAQRLDGHLELRHHVQVLLGGPTEVGQVVADDDGVDTAQNALLGADVTEGKLAAYGDPTDRAGQREPERGDH